MTLTPALSTAEGPTATPSRTATDTPSPTQTPSTGEVTSPLPTPSPTATSTPSPLACGETEGELVDDRTPAGALGYPIQLRLYLPPCYSQASAWRYPALYMLHGLSFNQFQWDNLGVDESADRLIAAGAVEPFIAVMPRGEPDDNWQKMLVDDVIPFVDANYRTLPERRYRSVGGLSLGGGWAVSIGFLRSDLFGAVGGHSPALAYVGERDVAHLLAGQPAERWPSIYIDIGDLDGARAQTALFADELTAFGIPHEFHIYPGGHNQSYWAAHVEDYLRFYGEAWREKPKRVEAAHAGEMVEDGP